MKGFVCRTAVRAMPEESRAEYYRRMAAQSQQLAEVSKDYTVKEAFLRTAQGWLELAEREEKRPGDQAGRGR
jgi:hypothetical protein